MAKSEKLTKPEIPDIKELNEETIKSQLQDSVDHHNKLIEEKERLIGDLKKVEDALNQSVGRINTQQGIIKE